MTRDFDLIVFGATGFTGRLVADYLARSPERPRLRWAVAGRNREKLEALGLDVPIVVGDALDPRAVRALAERTKVVCTTAGPFARYGSELVAACADTGTHYCDLTGEVAWMRRMIDAHHRRAQTTGARIVHTCGFDSIPSDLGTWAAQQAFIAQHGTPARKVTALFGEQRGGFSGGTVASGLETAREAAADPDVRRILADPYALDPNPGATRPTVRDERSIGWEPHLQLFTAPFVMAQVNTRVVRRAHVLAGQPWGADFAYREVMSTPGTARGAAMAVAITGGLAALGFIMARPMLREQLARRAPQPGDGPSATERARGHWTLRLIAEGAEGAHLVYVVADRADPGYGSTAKMLGESALCLALDPLDAPGGVQTPSVAMARPLLDRLRKAGLRFDPRYIDPNVGRDGAPLLDRLRSAKTPCSRSGWRGSASTRADPNIDPTSIPTRGRDGAPLLDCPRGQARRPRHPRRRGVAWSQGAARRCAASHWVARCSGGAAPPPGCPPPRLAPPRPADPGPVRRFGTPRSVTAGPHPCYRHA